MSTRSVVPFGPQHPVLPEPIHLDLVLEDEKVVEAVPSIGFIHRGLEKLVEKKDFQRICLRGGAHLRHLQLYARHGLLRGRGADHEY